MARPMRTPPQLALQLRRPEQLPLGAPGRRLQPLRWRQTCMPRPIVTCGVLPLQHQQHPHQQQRRQTCVPGPPRRARAAAGRPPAPPRCRPPGCRACPRSAGCRERPQTLGADPAAAHCPLAGLALPGQAQAAPPLMAAPPPAAPPAPPPWPPAGPERRWRCVGNKYLSWRHVLSLLWHTMVL